MNTSPHISTLRSTLLDTLADLRNRNNPMEPDRARAIAEVSKVIVDSARVEVEYLKATGQDCSNFIDGMKTPTLRIDGHPTTVHRAAWPTAPAEAKP
jgi:hypothetical protein